MANEATLKKTKSGKEFLEINGRKYPMFSERHIKISLSRAIKFDNDVAEAIQAQVEKKYPALKTKLEKEGIVFNKKDLISADETQPT